MKEKLRSDKEVSFKGVAAELLDKEERGIERLCVSACPDQCVGKVTFIDDSFHYILPEGASWATDFERSEPGSSPLADGAQLIMVLESPHLAEFGISPRGKVDRAKQAHPGPAKGPTGRLIRERLGRQRVSLGENVRPEQGMQLHLVLVNAIQHQCSLGRATKRYRDRVFERFWEAGGRESFVARLASLWNAKRGDIIVNCCTVGGNPKARLKAKVRDAIRAVVGQEANEQRVIELAHPSSWRYQRLERH